MSLDDAFVITDIFTMEEVGIMIDEKDIRDEGMEDYKRIANYLNKDYSQIARRADIITEECLRQMSRGADGVMKWQNYPIVYGIVFKELLDSVVKP